MRVVGELIRDSNDRISRGDPFVVSPRPRGRPIKRHQVRIGGAADVRRAREFGVPLHLVSPVDSAVFGYPLTFPPVVVVWRPLRDAVITNFAIQEFESRAASLRPRVEDLAIILLRIDALAARAILLRNREFVWPSYLETRILEEDCAAEASHVRLQEITPNLPVVGVQLSSDVLARQDRNSFTVGLL